MEKITITRALSELKLLDSRINKAIASINVVGLYQNRNDMVLGVNIAKDKFSDKVKGDYKSITDLIERRKSIKDAVLKSNSKTKVKIAANHYSVQEAIERKNSIQYEKTLLQTMNGQYVLKKNEINTKRLELEENVKQMLVANLGKESKTYKDDYDVIAKPFIANNEILMIDPLDVGKLIEKMEKEVEDFGNEVDFTLSESNAKTEIEV